MKTKIKTSDGPMIEIRTNREGGSKHEKRVPNDRAFPLTL